MDWEYSKRSENQRGQRHRWYLTDLIRQPDRLATNIFTDKVKGKATSLILNMRISLYHSQFFRTDTVLPAMNFLVFFDLHCQFDGIWTHHGKKPLYLEICIRDFRVTEVDGPPWMWDPNSRGARRDEKEKEGWSASVTLLPDPRFCVTSCLTPCCLAPATVDSNCSQNKLILLLSSIFVLHFVAATRQSSHYRLEIHTLITNKKTTI